MRKYVFIIDGYRPETLPFDRLLEYYEQLAKLFGDAGGLRLAGIFDSSHGSALRIMDFAVAGVDKRFAAHAAGEPPADMERAHETLDKMLAEDATSGRLENDEGGVVLQFTGQPKPDERALEVADSGTIVGHLYSWTLQKKDVNIKVLLPNGKKLTCNAPTNIALGLRGHLKEDVRLFGRGTWRRESSGWAPVTFVVRDFEALDQVTLHDAVHRLRSLSVTWPDDPLAEIASMNKELGKLQ